jgi:hypothetical protein
MVFQKDLPARLAPVHDVIERPGVFDPQRPGHAVPFIYFVIFLSKLKADVTPFVAGQG